ncbi:hypothetical protein L4D20_24200, partial [Vibrio kyushuensis]
WFGVSLDKEVDGDLTYTFTIDLDGDYSAEMADFLADGDLTVTYLNGDGVLQTPPAIANGGNLVIPGDASEISVSLGTLNDEIFEGVESFGLDVNVHGEIGDEGEVLDLNDSGSATIVDDLDGEDNADTPVLTVVSPDPVTEGDNAVFGVSLDKEVDGDLTYTFTIDLDGDYSAEMADFLADGDLTVTYLNGDGVLQTPPAIANGGNLVIPGDASEISVSLGTLN